MPEPGAIHIIRSVQKKWTVHALLSYFILSLAITLLFITLLIKLTSLSLWWSIPVLTLSFFAVFFIVNSWKVSDTDVTRFLNQQYPQLEESSGLLLKPYNSLSLLEKLQVKKVEQNIIRLPAPVSFNKKLKQHGLILLSAITLSTLLFFLPGENHLSQMSANTNSKATAVKPEKILPNISSVRVTIKPPVYTGNTSRTQSLFNIKAEEGANVSWLLQTTVQVDTMQLVINGSMIVPLHVINDDHTLWGVEKNFKSSGFYQVKMDGRVSDPYSIDLIKDGAPVIVIQKPKSYTVIDYGQPEQVNMSVSIEDDYGVKEAVISATITSGSGEGVKFKEQQLSFTNFSSGNRKYNLQKILDLPALGVKPGGELYFYVKSVDNHNQENRSDVYMVAIPDTAQLMSLDGLTSGVDIKPEYFRSQRQIIIETEQLLKDQKSLADEQFKNKSNDLGIDQKLLRLRYSKFLGQETDGPAEDDHHADHDHEAETNAAEDFGNAEKIMDQVAHKHDNAEDASFFDLQTKKQLTSILDEMWNAELRLRTFKPLDALPFEYKALRLLKDLQEKGRSYVAKASFKTTPLKPEKRLSGDLSKIIEPVTRTDFEREEKPEDNIRRALGVLENLKAETVINKTSLETLQQARVQLNSKASAEPSVYLLAVGAMNRVLEALENKTPYSATDLATAQKGLQRLLNSPAALPGPDKKSPDQNLSKQYFQNLQQGNH